MELEKNEISDLSGYLYRMQKSMIDKMFFIDKDLRAGRNDRGFWMREWRAHQNAAILLQRIQLHRLRYQ